MTSKPPIGDVSLPDSLVSRKVALARLLIGLAQGIVLYALHSTLQHKLWPATNGQIFAPLLLVTLFVPVILVSGLGHIAFKRILVWAIVASVITWGLGFYDVWRLTPGEAGKALFGRDTYAILPSFLVLFFTGVGLYIAQSLVLAATIDRRWIAAYASYFEVAWKLAIQIIFSSLFVGIMWLVLWLGASLFMLLKLNFLQDLLQKPWFYIPVTAFAFSSAFHITDVRPGIVRGIRTLLLVLMSWLLPLATLIVLGFVASLPLTGLAPLWATGHATAVLLGAAAVLVVLINAAFQNGEIASQLARILRGSARVAAVLLLPIVLIAIYSLSLRVGDYGWTTDRVIAAACLLVASCYAGGYTWAAMSRGDWLQRVAPTNVSTAFLVLAVLLAMFLPVADPARVSVGSQLARLESGAVSPAKFDFDYLKFSGERYGWKALQKLKGYAGADAPLVHAQVMTTLAKQYQGDQEPPDASAIEIADNLTVWPKGVLLPKSFLDQTWGDIKFRWLVPECLRLKDRKCDAHLIDFSGDGKAEILLMGQRHAGSALLMQSENGAWNVVGSLDRVFVACRDEIQKNLAAGTYRLAPPLIQDIEIAGQKIHITQNQDPRVQCPP